MTEPTVAETVLPEPPAETPPEVPSEAPIEAPRPVDRANPVWGVGRRKSSSARVRVFPGDGQFTVNGRPLAEYFNHDLDRKAASAALEALPEGTKYDVHVKVRGGGTTGQAGAVRHGLARALAKAEPSLEPALRDGDLMTRDARVSERKKYGRRGARRGFQFSKR